MKVFDSDDGYENKINFVDENNVFVGYDLSQYCCEHADWFISDKVDKDIPYSTNEIKEFIEKYKNKEGLENFSFDKEFFEEVEGDFLDEGRMVVFRITNGKQDKFIHLFNCHNGYYGHGFEFKVNDKIIKDECL